MSSSKQVRSIFNLRRKVELQMISRIKIDKCTKSTMNLLGKVSMVSYVEMTTSLLTDCQTRRLTMMSS